MSSPTLLQLQCFNALVTEGSFAAAAERLHKTHPTVHTAIKSLEELLGLALLDRSGYRTVLTPQGAAFHASTAQLLRQFDDLRREAAQLAAGEEPELRVVIGDLCPLPQTLGLIRRFFAHQTATRLHLMFEAISGPWERLQDGSCDVIFHHLDKPALTLETVPLFQVELVPVAAPALLATLGGATPTPEVMRQCVQCVIRDTSRRPDESNYHLIDGARTCSVPDQLMKHELIRQGLAWGHLPLHLVRTDLKTRRLVSLSNQHFRGASLPHYAARRRDTTHGPTAQRLWAHLQTLAPEAPRKSATQLQAK